MMKKFTQAVCLLLLAASGKADAQMLETVDMSTVTTGYNTYLTGINNKGYVTGYANTGNNIGFIITPSGKRLIVDPSVLGATDTKVESINDNDVPVAVVTVHNGSTPSIYKCYIDTLNDTIGSLVQVQNIGNTTSVAFDISDNNDISGWFQASTRFLWVKHDSIIPLGNLDFQSDRVFTSQAYNTMAGGINNANKVAGFYIDGTNYEPLVYDNILEMFHFLAITNKCKLWDINDNDWVAGEFMQNNNVWMAFIADVSTGSFTQFTSLKTIFADSSIQSVANAINDNGEVAGSFYHPTHNRWVGFIYHPGSSEYRIPGFAFNTGTWSMNNNFGVPNTVWPSSYWGSYNYTQMDPYVTNGTPLIDADILSANPGVVIPNSASVDWVSFAKETDIFGFGGSTNPYMQWYYHHVAKPGMFAKYLNEVTAYNGHCYGFTYSELLHHFDDPLFSNWFNIPQGTNINQVSNTNDDAIQAIARSYFRQSDIPTISQYSTGGCYNNETMWSGLHEMKMEFAKPFSESNPRSLSYQLPGGYHSVLPYKIRSPRKFPFDYPSIQYDTIFIHDSNEPQDSTKYMLAESYLYSMPHTQATYPGNTVNFISLNKISVRELMNIPMTQLKSTSAGDDPQLILGIDGPSYYTISTGSGQATANGSGYANSTTELLGLEYETQTSSLPVGHLMDTTAVADLHSYNYTGSAMKWRQTNKYYAMGISRTASASEADNGQAAIRRLSYGNPDNTTKYLTCYFIETDPNLNQGTSIVASNVCAAPGDSIVTKSNSHYTYTITKINGTTNCTYDLTIFAAYNGDSIKEFHAPVTMNGTTSHTIDPYFTSTNGSSIAVIVDDGMDGITDDTLFVTGWPVGMEQVLAKNGVKVYPNPVQSELTVEFSQTDNYSIVLTDIVGKVVYNNTVSAKGKVQFPVAQYPAGVYLIQVMDSKGTVLLKDKIVKQ